MRRLVRTLRTGWLAVLLSGCAYAALAGDKEPQEYLDEDTAATITVVGEPLVFAYARRDLAVNARDYVTLAAAAVNRAGKVSYVIIGYNWSTVDPRLRPDPLPAAEPMVLQADDRRIPLTLRGHSAHEAGIGAPVHAPPGTRCLRNVYGSDLATLRFLAEARHLKLLSESEVTVLEFELWDDRRAACADVREPHERRGLKRRHCGYSAAVRMTAVPPVHLPAGVARACMQMTDI